MIVVKLGGSLAKSDTLLKCLNRVKQKYRNEKIVIVPGGGAFADQIRIAQQHWQFNDQTAHRMAILAMQQMALLFKGLNDHFAIAGSLKDIHQQLSQKNIVIWSPDITELDDAGIQPAWEISSDSLAAWLAGILSARELILVKSAIIDPDLSLQALSEQDIVDKSFCDFVARSSFKISIVNAIELCSTDKKISPLS